MIIDNPQQQPRDRDRDRERDQIALINPASRGEGSGRDLLGLGRPLALSASASGPPPQGPDSAPGASLPQALLPPTCHLFSNPPLFLSYTGIAVSLGGPTTAGPGVSATPGPPGPPYPSDSFYPRPDRERGQVDLLRDQRDRDRDLRDRDRLEHLRISDRDRDRERQPIIDPRDPAAAIRLGVPPSDRDLMRDSRAVAELRERDRERENRERERDRERDSRDVKRIKVEGRKMDRQGNRHLSLALPPTHPPHRSLLSPSPIPRSVPTHSSSTTLTNKTSIARPSTRSDCSQSSSRSIPTWSFCPFRWRSHPKVASRSRSALSRPTSSCLQLTTTSFSCRSRQRT